MKRTIKLAVVATLALGATSAFATNGATMIGYGAKSFGMGGTGIGVSHGAESALSNPAMITSVEGSEVSFGGTLFLPDVETDMGTGAGFVKSDSDMFMIPSVSIATKVNDNFYWGIGMWGTGGLGVDYRNSAANFNMQTSLAVMQFGVPLVYTSNNFSLGITPLLQYGAMDIQHANMATGAGIAQDLQFGYNLGLSYETNGITLGAVYKSEIKMDYKDVLELAMDAFTAGAYAGTELSTPAEYGVGVSYKMKEHTIAVDYKMINWADASGYQDFKWEDQDVIAVGYEYATDGWAVRCGYQYAESAVQEQALAAPVDPAIGLNGPVTNTLNLLGFPGTMESHVTVGGTYNFNEKISLDLAAVYGLEAKDTYQAFNGGGVGPVTTKHAESSYSFQVNFAF